MFSVKEISDIECDFREGQMEAYADALDELALYGIEVGVWVETLDYRDRLKNSLYLHGKKLRRDGTFGNHIHSISSPDRVRVVDASESEQGEKP